jgi:outer membrane protein OmpA-like peptidoglycan-associated protein
MNITVGLMAILTLAAVSQPASAQVYSGPLQPHVGGQVTTAFSNSFGPDAESTLTFKQVNASVLGVDYSSTRGLVVHRNIRVIDRQDATTYVLGYAQTMPVVIPNTTSLGISAASLIELRTTGQTALSLIYDSDLAKIDGVLTLVAKDIKAPLLIEDQLIQVPVVHATGTFAGGRGNRRGTGDFYFIDDKNNPMMLEDTIQFNWEDQPRAERITRVTAGKSMESAMEKTLKTLRSLDLYGIHFDFDKATIRPDTASLIADIAVTLKHNPTWRLQINGHTDSIGDAAYNQKLSADRAAAVKDAIVKQGIAASRLQTAGLGQTKPKSGNDTLEGRSLNRRVELVRTDR